MDNDVKVVKLKRPRLSVSYFKSVEDAADHFISVKERPIALVALNATKLVTLFNDENTFNKLKNIQYYPDGSSICWFAKDSYSPIPGVELWLEIIARAVAGSKIVIIGSDQKTNLSVIEKLRMRHQHLSIEGLHGYLNGDAYDALVRKVQPDFIFCALGSPKQEILMAQLQSQCENAIVMGLGGSLDVFVGKVQRAPLFFQKNRIEFLYRIMRQPRRVFRQKPLIIFLWLYLIKAFTASTRSR